MSDAIEKLKPGRWYWIAGKGPMKFEEGNRFKAFCSGYDYWASPEDVGGKCNANAIDRHFDQLCEKVERPTLSGGLAEYLRGLPGNMTLGEVSNRAVGRVVSNKKHSPEDVQAIDIGRYGIPVTVGQLLAKASIK